MTSTRSVAIVGAGASGLVSAKILLDDGFDVTVFDKQSQLGGIWCEDGSYYNLHTQQPGGTMEFSDLFDGQEYSSWQHTHEYLSKYADKFNITPRIRLRTVVISISKDDDDVKNASKPWKIVVKSLNDDSEQTQLFDLVVIAGGLLSNPYMPKFKGQEKFSGDIIHSSQLKSSEKLSKKIIAVIGGSKSAADMAVLAAEHGEQCYMIFRRIHWLVPRYLFRGIIEAKHLFTKVFATIYPQFPSAPHGIIYRFFHSGRFSWLFDMFYDLAKIVAMKANGKDLYNDKIFIPQGSFKYAENSGALPDNFVKLKRDGKIIGKLASIDEIIGERIIKLDTGEQLEIDMILCATGFVEGFPFFSEHYKELMNISKPIDLYRHIIPIGTPNLAFVGYFPTIAHWMTAEIAAHWISDYFLGRIQLPAEKEMMQDVSNTQKFAKSLGHGKIPYYYWLEPMEMYLNDMKLSLTRTNNWLQENFGIISPARFKDLHHERKTKGNKKFYLSFVHCILLIVFIYLLVILIQFISG